jgi:hypothetical protein
MSKARQNNVIQLLFRVDSVLSSITKKVKFKFIKIISTGLKNKKCPRLRQYQPLAATACSVSPQIKGKDGQRNIHQPFLRPD